MNEVAKLTGQPKAEAARKALEERRVRLAFPVPEDRRARAMSFLEREVWPKIPPALLGRGISREEQEEILGYRS